MDTTLTVDAGDMRPSESYKQVAFEDASIAEGLRELAGSEAPQDHAAALEFVLEGLFRTRRIGKVAAGSSTRYAR